MALNLIQTITFYTTDNPTFNINDVLQSYYDDSTNAIVVKLNSTIITSGPSLTTGKVQTTPYILYYTVNQTGYSFCNGTTYESFGLNTVFPYVTMYGIANAVQCPSGGGGTVNCDIAFSLSPTLTQPTTPTAGNGQISVTATSSNGTVKYALSNIDWSLMSAYGMFTGLNSGTYTIYAKDSSGCLATLQVVLKAQIDYEVLYRINYNNQAGNASRIDILQNGYTGSIIELDTFGSPPILLRMRGENSDKFTPILPSEADVNLISNGDFDFSIFFTNYEHTFICIFYKDLGSGLTEIWRGANMPGLYTEPFVQSPYPVTVTFTDQLGILDEHYFLQTESPTAVNFSGTLSVIQIIALILEKTGLTLPIRSGVNMFDTGMTTTSSDDPLAQAYINVDCFYDEDLTNPKTCQYVLQELLKPFGARIIQAYGYWWILRLDELTTTFNYRQFDTAGAYVSNGTFSEVINSSYANDTSRIVLDGGSATMEIIRSYGVIEVDQSTVPFGSILPNYGFEKPFDANTQYGIPDWLFVLNGANEAPYITSPGNGGTITNEIVKSVSPYLKVSTIEDLNSLIPTNQCVKVVPSSGVYPTLNAFSEGSYLQSKALTDFTVDPLDDFEFDIDYFIDLGIGYGTGTPAYMGFRFCVTIGDWFLCDANEGVTNFNNVNSQSYLKATTTTSVNVGLVLSYVDQTNLQPMTYKLIASTATENDPLLVRPNDYNASTNAKQWQLITFGNWNYLPGQGGNPNSWIEVVEQNPKKGWKTHSISGQMPPVAATGQLLVVFIMPMWYNPIKYNFDPDRQNKIEAIPTSDKNPGFLSYAIHPAYISGSSNTAIMFAYETWQLKVGELGTDFAYYPWSGSPTPNSGIIIPNDFDQNYNNVVWKLVDSTNGYSTASGNQAFNRTYFYASGGIDSFDNVKFICKPKATTTEFNPLPGNIVIDAPKNLYFILTNNALIKNNLTYSLFLGDATALDNSGNPLINNAKYIYRNFFQLSNGNPTSKWTRTGLDEALSIGALLCQQLLQQYVNPTWKLTGTFETRYFQSGVWKEQPLSFISTILQNSRYLIPYYMEIDDRNNIVKVETQEIIAKSAYTTTTGFSAAFSSSQFGNSFNN